MKTDAEPLSFGSPYWTPADPGEEPVFSVKVASGHFQPDPRGRGVRGGRAVLYNRGSGRQWMVQPNDLQNW